MTQPSAPPQPSGLSGPLITLLAVACGVAVGNVYFPQAISPLIASGMNVRASSGAAVVTATQVGYAAGIFFLVPLGDRLRHRPLLVTLLLLTSAGLAAAGTATSLSVLLVASSAIGLTTVVPQIILPMAAGLTPAHSRGAVTGKLLSGLIGGILLARTFSGTLGQWLSWRAPYLIAAGVVGLFALILARTVPRTTPTSQAKYLTLIAGVGAPVCR